MFFVLGILLFAFAAQGIWMLTGPDPLSVAPTLMLIFKILHLVGGLLFFVGSAGLVAAALGLLLRVGDEVDGFVTMIAIGAFFGWAIGIPATLTGTLSIAGMGSLGSFLALLGVGGFVVFAAVLRYAIWGPSDV